MSMMTVSIKRLSSVLGAAVLAIALTPAAGPAHAASFTVNSTADAVDANPGNGVCATAAGVCTLRAAIQEVNALGGGPHTITVPAGTFQLTIPNPNLDLNKDGVPDDEEEPKSGDLDIKPPVTGGSVTVTINGAGRGVTVIDVNGTLVKDRGFDIHSGATVTISNLSIKNGNPIGKSGGGIRNRGTLTVNKVSLSRNTASNGGGIRSSGPGSLTVIDSTVHDNVANEGGGIRVSNTARISGTTIYKNKAGSATVQGFGGGLDVDNGATVTINGNTRIYENESSYKGGGVDNDGTLTVADSSITSNRAAVAGGGIDNTGSLTLTRTTVAYNTPDQCSPGPCSQYATP